MQEFLEGEQFDKMAKEYNAKYQTAFALTKTKTIVEQALNCFLNNKPFGLNTSNSFQKEDDAFAKMQLGFNSDAFKHEAGHLLFDLHNILKPKGPLVLRWQKQAFLKVEQLQKLFSNFFLQINM